MSHPTVVLFCADPLRRNQVDTAYAEEAATAMRAGFRVSLLDYEALIAGDADVATHDVGGEKHAPAASIALYRGWMLTPELYARLYTALAARGVLLVNDPEAYAHSHLLPEWYPVLEGHTPASVWLPPGGTPGDAPGAASAGVGTTPIPFERVHALLKVFGHRPLVLKDYVKSRKHEWLEACFIPSAADRAAVERVVRRFVALQGPELAGGLVFREFVPLEIVGAHPRSGAPQAREFRLFFFDGEPISVAPYWSTDSDDDANAEAGEGPPVETFRMLARRVRSRFFTMDVARRADGEWTVIELGDGQVAGLPDHVSADTLYTVLTHRIRSE